jgi:hypothetical protein
VAGAGAGFKPLPDELDHGHDEGEVFPDTAETLNARTGRGLAWRTLTGREYITYPKSWTEALDDPDHPDHDPPTRHGLDRRAACEAPPAPDDTDDEPPF